jgi:nucleotide-binding universal stress UspA family protein
VKHGQASAAVAQRFRAPCDIASPCARDLRAIAVEGDAFAALAQRLPSGEHRDPEKQADSCVVLALRRGSTARSAGGGAGTALATAPVMVSFKKILVPVDFGESSKQALDLAIDLAKQYGSELTLLHTWEIPVYGYGAMEFSAMDMLTPIQGAATEQLDALLVEVRRQLPATKGLIARGVAWRELLTIIEESRPDLVVMGTHGRRGLGRAILGSVAEKIVRMSPVPVLTVRSKNVD